MRIGFLMAIWISSAAVVGVAGCGGSSSTSSGSGAGTTGATSTTGAGGGSGTTGTTSTTGTNTGTGGSTTTTTTTTSSGQGGFGGSAAGGDCGMCVNDKKVFAAGTACNMAYSKCSQDQTCSDFLTCADNCLLESPQTVECWSACEQAASSVSNLYQPFVDCICTSCKADCSAACP